MSCNYADGLSAYHNKGKCGLAEIFDAPEVVESKVATLADWFRQCKHIVVHTGAGISTAAGIPDFRGPKGVWTLEGKNEKPDVNVSFVDAKPTLTHMALVALQQMGFIKYLVSQNIDGLHLKSGFPRSHMSELHGNIFVEQCKHCKRQFIRSTSVETVGQKCLEKPCPLNKPGGRRCRGKLFDNILDWEDQLPDKDLEMAEMHSRKADLSLTLGSTLQIVPSGSLPLATKGNKGKLVICNLQPTKNDKRADMKINTYVDDVMSQLCKHLGVTIPEYTNSLDPTLWHSKNDGKTNGITFEWTIQEKEQNNRKDMKSCHWVLHEVVCRWEDVVKQDLWYLYSCIN